MIWVRLMVRIRTITRHKFPTIRHSLPRTRVNQIIARGLTEETYRTVKALMGSSTITRIQKRGILSEDPDERGHQAAREAVVLGEAEVEVVAEEVLEIRELTGVTMIH